MGHPALELDAELEPQDESWKYGVEPSDHPVDPKSGTRSARFDPRPKASKNTETRAEPESAKVIFEQCSDALLYIFRWNKA